MFPIEHLVTGDEVITSDSRIARVHKAHVASAPELVCVTFSDGSSVVCTPWHRFFELRGALIQAELLQPGTYIRNYDFSIAEVVRVESSAKGVAKDVYNLSLERDAGFFANGKLVEAPHASRVLNARALLTRA
jgi:hypothetical protein